MARAFRFTRKEVMESTGCTSNQLQSYERAGLVVPKRTQQPGLPTVSYTRQQLLQVKAIRTLREQISLQTIRKIVEFLDRHGIDSSLHDKQIVVIDNDVFWVAVDWADFSTQMPKALKVASKRRKEVGQYVLIVIPPLIKIASEILKAAKKSSAIDFVSFKHRFESAA